MALPVPADVQGDTVTDNMRATWAKQAGFPASEIATAVAVSIAENQAGRVDAIGGPNSDGSRDYGLWQINERAHPGLFQRYPRWWSIENANMAKAVWAEAGNSWRPWSTFQAGKHNAYMERGRKAAAESSGGAAGQTDPETRYRIPFISDSVDAIAAVADTIRGLANGVKAVAGAGVKAGQWMANPDNWVRVAQVGVGGGLLIAGITVVIRPALKPITNAATTVAGPGGAAKAAGASKTSKPTTQTKAE